MSVCVCVPGALSTFCGAEIRAPISLLFHYSSDAGDHKGAEHTHDHVRLQDAGNLASGSICGLWLSDLLYHRTADTVSSTGSKIRTEDMEGRNSSTENCDLFQLDVLATSPLKVHS